MSCWSPGKTVNQVQSTAYFGEVVRTDTSSHGIAMDLLLALPFACGKYWLPPTSLVAEQEVLAPSHGSVDKGENQAAFPDSLERQHLPATQEGLPGEVSVWVTIIWFFVHYLDPVLRPWLEACQLPFLGSRLISYPKHLPYGNLKLQATIQSPRYQTSRAAPMPGESTEIIQVNQS